MRRAMKYWLFAWSLLAFTSSLWAVEPVLNSAIKKAFDAGELPGLHSALVDYQGQRLAEVYFSGRDQNWGSDLGVRQHSPDSLHDLRSVTKSVVGLLYGIALSQGKVPTLDQPLLAQFPGYADLKDGGDKEKILVAHALSMRMGIEWREDLPYTDKRNSEIAMEFAPDRYRYVLEQKMQHEPGTVWTYSGGAVALVAKLIADGVGMPIDEFAKKLLFQPLGINRFEWAAGRDGVPSAASGLRLTLSDLNKIGHLVANDGIHNKKPLVPESWLKQSFITRSKLRGELRYGYLWYLFGKEESPVVIALGNGGQRLTVNPASDLVASTFAGRYNDPQGWQTSLKILLDFVAPEIRGR